MASFKEMVGRLALQKWVLKQLTDENKALNADVRDAMQQLYDAGGVKQVAAEVNGAKVGTVSATVSKGSTDLAVTNNAALLGWAREHGFVTESVDMGRVQLHFEETGEVPDGCRVETRPGGFKTVTVRFDKEAKENIQRLMDTSELGAAVRGLLGGTNER